MRFTFTYSHLFPGARVTLAQEGEEGEGGAAPAEFADGVTLIGAWRRAGAGIVLDLPAYRTARGTAITARRWHLVPGPDGVWRARRG